MKKLYASISFVLIFTLNSFAQGTAPCSDLFFSEYIEGSSNNKALEIFNPTGSAIDLSDYKVVLYTNGSSTPTTTFLMKGSIAANDVYVIANSQAATGILNVKDTVSGVTNFNGDDAIALEKISLAQKIDVIGVIGIDPGTEWTVGTGSTLDHTLTRKVSVQNGQLSWVTGANEWDVYLADEFSFLGFHSMAPCSSSGNPILFFHSTLQSVNEGAGNVTILVDINNPNSNPTSATVRLFGGTATLQDDYYIGLGGEDSVIVTFPANSTTQQSVTVHINDDAIVEGDEYFLALLYNVTNNGSVHENLDSITIIDNDATAARDLRLEGLVKIFPNPSTNNFVLTVNAAFDNLTITNVTGEVLKQQIISGMKTVNVSLKELPSGIYFITCSGAGENYYGKIVKE